MVPLTGANRVLAWFGVAELRRAARPGLRALMEVSRVRPGRLVSSDVGYKLAPRINAAGRLADATVGVQLLLTDDMQEGRRIAEVLDAANGNRQRIEGAVFRDAVARVDALAQLPDALVLADEGWHPGVVGIVCTKLVERYDRPVVLIGEGGRGSARTARGLHLYDAIADCAEHLTKFGGHRAAAGLRIASARVDAFRSALLARVRADPDFGGVTESILRYDDELAAAEVDAGTLEAVRRLEPFGNGNPEPLFLVRNVHVRAARLVGGEHLKLRLEEGQAGGLSAIAFKRKELLDVLPSGARIELTCHLEDNDYSGVPTLELRVRDLRPLDADRARTSAPS
jgi:single-stranded-DNA-specific exonuclease